jgi:hypothetical protein
MKDRISKKTSSQDLPNAASLIRNIQGSRFIMVKSKHQSQ